MKKVLFLIIIVVFSSFVLPSVAFAEYSFPKPNGYVNDYAGVIDQNGYDYLTSLIEYTEQNTSSEIAVVTLDSINESGLDTKSYAVKLFEQWGIGKKEKNNGVLILLVMDQRRIEIEVGYGLEGILPDGKAGRIIRDRINYFKNDSYSEGLQWIAYDVSNAILIDDVNSINVNQRDSNSLDYIPDTIYIFFVALTLATTIMLKKKGKCPKCKNRMKYKFEKAFIVYTCSKCHYKRKEKRKYWMIMAGSSSSSGSSGGFGGGFGGGSSGGGGAGGSF